MSNKPSDSSALLKAVRGRLITILVWVAVAAVIFIVVSINRANEAATEAKLASPDQSVRDSVVLQLAMNNHLIDALSNTQDPNTNSDSPQNTRSKKIYSDSANSMNRLIDSGRIPDSVAFSNLFMLYKDGDSKTGATLGLAKLAAKSDANRHYLVQRLADGDPDVRNAAVDSLSFASGPDLATSQTASEVVKLIKNTSAQDSAESALNKIGKPSVPYLLPYIDDADLAFREQIVTMLGTIGSAEAAPDLIRLATANPPNPPIRRLALVSLAQIVLATIPAPPPPGAKTPPAKPDPVAVAKALSAAPVLTAALNNPSDDSLARSQSALALGRIASLQAVTALVGALGDLDSRVRQFATDGIQAAGPVAVPALAEALKSANGTVRASAASALGGIGNPAALSAIKPALADPQVDVRMAAAQGMGASANTSSIPMLVSQLSDTSGFVAGAASNALVVIGDPAVPSLIAALGSPSQATCLFAAEALQHIGNPAVPPLIRAAQSGSQGQKTWSAVALGRIHDPQSKPVLQELAASANPSTRWAAQQALQQFSATES